MVVTISCNYDANKNTNQEEILISEDEDFQNSVILKIGYTEISVETSKLTKALFLFEKK